MGWEGEGAEGAADVLGVLQALWAEGASVVACGAVVFGVAVSEEDEGLHGLRAPWRSWVRREAG